MRALTQNELQTVHGGYFIEGIATDDFIVAGLAIGLVSALGLGVYARMRYNKPELPVISLKDIATCTLHTGLLGAKYGLVVDCAFGAISFAKNLIF